MYSSVLVGLMKRVDSLQRERQQADVPAGEELRQQRRTAAGRGSGCSARCGSAAGSIFTTGPTITICHAGSASASAPSSVEVEALVDHAEEAEARRGDRALQPLGRAPSPARRRSRCGGEVRGVDALGKQCTLAWRSRLASYRLGPPVNTRSALFSSAVSRWQQLARRVLERGQLVHAVVDDGARRAARPAAAAPSACRTRRRSRRSAARRR